MGYTLKEFIDKTTLTVVDILHKYDVGLKIKPLGLAAILTDETEDATPYAINMFKPEESISVMIDNKHDIQFIIYHNSIESVNDTAKGYGRRTYSGFTYNISLVFAAKRKKLSTFTGINMVMKSINMMHGIQSFIADDFDNDVEKKFFDNNLVHSEYNLVKFDISFFSTDYFNINCYDCKN